MRAAAPEGGGVVRTGAAVGVLYRHLEAVGGGHCGARARDGGHGDVHVRGGVEFEAVEELAALGEGTAVRRGHVQPVGLRGDCRPLDGPGVLVEGVRAGRSEGVGAGRHPCGERRAPGRAVAAHRTAATTATRTYRGGQGRRPGHPLARPHVVRRRPMTRHPSSSPDPGPWPILPRSGVCHPRNPYERPKRPPRRHLVAHRTPSHIRGCPATQNPDRSAAGVFRIRCRYSRTRGHGVSRLRPQILLGAIRLDLAVHEEPADGGQCDQEKLLHRATSSFLDVGDLCRPTIHTDRYRSVTCVRSQLPSGTPQ